MENVAKRLHELSLGAEEDDEEEYEHAMKRLRELSLGDEQDKEEEEKHENAMKRLKRIAGRLPMGSEEAQGIAFEIISEIKKRHPTTEDSDLNSLEKITLVLIDNNESELLMQLCQLDGAFYWDLPIYNCYPPIHYAALQDKVACLEVLLDCIKPDNVDRVNHPYADTPMGLAAMSGSFECIKLLIDKGANAKQRTGLSTLLHTAVFVDDAYKQKKCIEALIGGGANVNARSYGGDTPLHSAAGKGHRLCIEALLDRGADKNAQNNENETPLHIAALFCNVECIRVLLERGADTAIKDERGRTPHALAKRHRLQNSIDVFEEYGIKE